MQRNPDHKTINRPPFGGGQGHLLRQEDGFSLLELLVALAILSLAAIPLMAGQSDSLKQAAKLQEKTLAQMVAENVVVRLRNQPSPPAAGQITGTEIQAGVPFHWQATIVRQQSSGLVTMTVRVGAENPANLKGFQTLVQLTGFRKAGQ